MDTLYTTLVLTHSDLFDGSSNAAYRDTANPLPAVLRAAVAGAHVCILRDS